MLKNFWGEKKEFYCLNHEPPIPLYVYDDASSPFYACRKFMRKDEAHPDGHDPDELACANRLSFTMAIRLIENIMKEIEGDISGIGTRDYTGWVFKYKGIEARILECDGNGKITKIGISNRSEITRWINM